MVIENQNSELRKIQFSGRTSFMVALPKKWAQEIGLRQGDVVKITPQNNRSLLITAKGLTSNVASESLTTAQVVIDPLTMRDNFGQVLRKIISLYLNGYANMDIEVACEGKLTSSQRTIISELVRRSLIGTEMIGTTLNGISLKVLLNHSELSIRDAVRRMFLVTSSMHNNAIKVLGSRDRHLVDSVLMSDDEVDRFCFYTIRQIHMAQKGEIDFQAIGLRQSSDLLTYLIAANVLESTADLACRIAVECDKISEPIPDQIATMLRTRSESAIGLVADSMLSLFEHGYDGAEKVVQAVRTFGIQLEEDFALAENRANSSNLQSCLSHLLTILASIKLTAERANDIAKAVLNLSASVAEPSSVEKVALAATAQI